MLTTIDLLSESELIELQAELIEIYRILENGGFRIEEPVFLITFANASQFGNNAFIAPAASMTDDLVDVVVVRKFAKIWMSLFAVALFSKLISKLPFVDCYKARQIELEMADTPYYHFDGEPGRLNVPARIKLDAAKIWMRCGK